MENIIEYLKVHYQYVLITAGLVVLIGAVKDWKWVTRHQAKHAFLFEMLGEKGYRVFIGICGLVLAFCGIVFLMLDKR